MKDVSHDELGDLPGYGWSLPHLYVFVPGSW